MRAAEVAQYLDTHDDMLRLSAAAALLGVSKRNLLDLPIARYDYRRPGAKRPAWRWRRGDLEAWRASRRVEPGHTLAA